MSVCQPLRSVTSVHRCRTYSICPFTLSSIKIQRILTLDKENIVCLFVFFYLLLSFVFTARMKRLIDLNAGVFSPFFFYPCCSSSEQIELEWAKSHNWLYYPSESGARKRRNGRENKARRGCDRVKEGWGVRVTPRADTPTSDVICRQWESRFYITACIYSVAFLLWKPCTKYNYCAVFPTDLTADVGWEYASVYLFSNRFERHSS